VSWGTQCISIDDYRYDFDVRDIKQTPDYKEEFERRIKWCAG